MQNSITKTKVASSSLYEVITRQSNNTGSDFTIKSNKTGKEYTYKITRSKFNEKWYTHVFVEKEYLNFDRLGTYFDGKIINKGKQVDTPSAIAICWVLSRVQLKEFNKLDELVEILHTGSCLVCGRTLTDSESIKSGLGPVCRNN